jgi:hypothetical protein
VTKAERRPLVRPPPDRLVIAVCRDCGLLCVTFTLAEKRAGDSVALCPECNSKDIVYVRYQLVARAVDMSRRPRQHTT